MKKTVNKKILVTGGYGFIGSNLINKLVKRPDVRYIFNVDFCGHGANPNNLLISDKIINIEIDINNIESHDSPIKYDTDFDEIYHLAAESHVDRSITSPSNFIHSNINGTLAMLEFHRKQRKCRFLMVSTDEVYGSLNEWDPPFNENSPLNPSSPYSASKASSDLLCLSYMKTYNSDIIITRSSNNFGPHQYKEKFIPSVINSILDKRPVVVYDEGKQYRQWTPVDTHVNHLIFLMENGDSQDIYNVGGGIELQNIYVVNKIHNLLVELNHNREGNNILQINFVKDARPGHDFRYSLNINKLKEKLNRRNSCGKCHELCYNINCSKTNRSYEFMDYSENEFLIDLERTIRYYIDQRSL